MFTSRDEHPVPRGDFANLPNSPPPLHPHAERRRPVDQRLVEPMPRERQRRERKPRRGHAPTMREPHLADRLRPERQWLDAHPAQFSHRLDAQELAADLMMRASLALDHQRAMPRARQMARGRRPSDTTADDDGRSHFSRSTHSRNGKRQTTLACETPARASSAAQSRLRNARATESGPSWRTNGCQRATRESIAKP